MRFFYEGLTKIVNLVPTGLPYNFARDLTWAFFAFQKLGMKCRYSSDVDSQFYAQWTFSTLAMFPLLRTHAAVNKFLVRGKPQKGAIATLAASLSIPVWNKAGQLGQNIGEQLQFSSVTAGYFAAIFTGIAEGSTQELIISLCSLLFIEQERQQFKLNPQKYLLRFSIKMGFAATVGMLPGAVWQLIANACDTNNVNLILSTIAVAFGVGLCNITYTQLQEKCLATGDAGNDDEYDTDGDSDSDNDNNDEKNKCCQFFSRPEPNFSINSVIINPEPLIIHSRS